MPWTNDTVLEFIELYGKEQILWDPKHPSNRNRLEITTAWQKIQSSLSTHISIMELKRKKESLLASFRWLWKKRKRNPGYNISWFAYDALNSFLGSKYDCDSTNELESEFFTNTVTYFTPKEANGEDPISCSHALPANNNSYNSDKYSGPNKRKMKSNSSAEYRNKSDYTNEDQDECDLYAQLLAKKLKKLNEHQRDIAMHEIDNIMFRAKMQSNSSVNTIPSSKIKSPICIVAQPQGDTHYINETITYEEHNQSQPSS